jgi:hypothetical protein
MTYIVFTQIDAQTGIPVTVEPAQNGPTMPSGCVFGFALESEYPTTTPTFYGQTSGPTDAPGILAGITKAEYDAALAAEMAAREAKSRPPVPASVTMRRAKLALSRVGKLTAANDAIAGMAGQAGEEARIEWQYATELRRDHPLVTGIGQALGLSTAAIDALFVTAEAIA